MGGQVPVRSVGQLCEGHVPVMFGMVAARKLEAGDLPSKFGEEPPEVRDVERADAGDAQPRSCPGLYHALNCLGCTRLDFATGFFVLRHKADEPFVEAVVEVHFVVAKCPLDHRDYVRCRTAPGPSEPAIWERNFARVVAVDGSGLKCQVRRIDDVRHALMGQPTHKGPDGRGATLFFTVQKLNAKSHRSG